MLYGDETDVGSLTAGVGDITSINQGERRRAWLKVFNLSCSPQVLFPFFNFPPSSAVLVNKPVFVSTSYQLLSCCWMSLLFKRRRGGES